MTNKKSKLGVSSDGESYIYPVEPSSSDTGVWSEEDGQFEFAVALQESLKEEPVIYGASKWRRVSRKIVFVILYFVFYLGIFALGWWIADLLKG